MNFNLPRKVAAMVLGSAGLGLGVTADHASRPNIIVIMTDDQGRADLGIYGKVSDVKTPHLDQLARSGANFTSGYITAPQCAPSRAGLLSGRYQQRFGFDSIVDGPMPLNQQTIATRLREAGYTTGMVGKWHLEPNHGTVRWAQQNHPELVENGRFVSLPFNKMEPYYPAHFGFEYFYLNNDSPYYVNFDLEGNDVTPARWDKNATYRIDAKTEAALAFIRRQQKQETPFFLYLAYYAPHVPLNAPAEYLARFPGEMPERRRHALAMISAIDDGVGRIMETIEDAGMSERTMVVFLSDNGAPLGAHQGTPMKDAQPAEDQVAAWDGSRNEPFRGEKGMWSEGGIRVPFLMSWPGTIPAGLTFKDPVISLDIAATANAAANLPDHPVFDGVNLLPFLRGTKQGQPHDDLYWKFWNQSAVRSGNWKYLQIPFGSGFLFDLENDPEETHNLLDKHPEKARELHAKLSAWTAEMMPRTSPDKGLNDQEKQWYSHYFNTRAEESP